MSLPRQHKSGAALYYVRSNLWGSRLGKQKTPTIYSGSSCWLIVPPPGLTGEHYSGRAVHSASSGFGPLQPIAPEHRVCVALMHTSEGF